MTDDSLTIRSLSGRAVKVPLGRPMKTAVGELQGAPLVLIDIETEEGVTGRAYIFAYTPLMLRPLVAVVEELSPLLVGKAVAPVERMREIEGTFRLLGRQGLLGMTLSVIDMALWDILARAKDLPLVGLLGGAVKPTPAYDSYGVIDPVRDRKDIEATLDSGFRALKIKIGDAGLEKDVATVAALREMVGDDIRIMVDFNQSRTVPEAIRRIERLAAFDLEWVEEPVPAEDLNGHAEVRAATDVPIQTGENWWFAQDMAKAIDAGASDLAMPDVMKIGGVTGWLKAAALAEAASLPVSSHAFVEASAHLLAVTPTAHWLEVLDKARPILQRPALIENGMVTPQGPGLGMEWDEAAVARYAA